MYESFFGFRDDPFALTPDPRFLFLGQHHREALAHLLYGMGESGGFVQLTGEVGTGKTTLCRSLLEQAPADVDVALILNPRQTPQELVASVCDELGVAYPPGTESLKVLTDLLNRHLLDRHEAGRRTVLVIDEAQNLSAEALEQVRLLTNLETTTHKLLQILLIGQPELRELMARRDLRQLAQRVTARYHLPPLTAEETTAYIRHRLEVAGCAEPLFTAGAVRRIHRLSGGVPRVVNVLCDRALLGGYAEGRRRIDRRLVGRASAEVLGRGDPAPRGRGVWVVAAVAAAAGLAWLLLPLTGLGPGDRPSSGEVFGRPVPSPAVAEPAPAAPVPQPVPAPIPAVPEAQVGPGPESLPPEPPPPEPSFGERLQSGRFATATDAAFANLFRRWELSYADLPGETACERAASARLRCLYGRGNWTTLAWYNLPAVLELSDPVGGRHQVVLVGLDEEHAALDVGGEEVRIPRAEVEAHWLGDFLLLWRPPPEGSELLRLGSAGADVLWLRAQLARAGGDASLSSGGARSLRYDEALRERVVRFQTARGLRPDGIAGEQTLVHLTTATGDHSVPVLRRP